MNPKELIGIHGPNRKMADLPNGVQTYIDQLRASGGRWAKFLYPDHTRADAAAAKALGYKVIVRANGEGFVHVADVWKIIDEFAGVCDWIEVGNEPGPDALHPGPDWVYHHIWYMNVVWRECADRAHNAGMLLCAPGWRGNDMPFTGDRMDPALAGALQGTYKQYDGIAVHAYGTHVLEQPQIERIKLWAAVFYDKPLLITEAGIGANDLVDVPPDPARYAISRLIKAQRYGAFAKLVAAQIDRAICVVYFMADGALPGWGNFIEAAPGEFVPDGPVGYFIGIDGWAQVAQAVA